MRKLIVPILKAVVSSKKSTDFGLWVQLGMEVENQDGTLVAAGNAMAEFLDVIPGSGG